MPIDEASQPEPVSAVPAAPVGSGAPDRVMHEPPPSGRYGRVPELALFLGGFLTCLGLVLSVLALNGTIHPSTQRAATVIGTPRPTGGTSPSPAISAAALATMVPIVTPAAMTPTDLASGYSLGKPTAKVTVEAWEDFQCPFCRQFTLQVEPQLVATYVETGKVRFVFRDFAFLGNESAWAAVAAALAEQQSKFWPYHDYLFANQLGENVGSFTVARLESIADAVGLDRSRFDAGLQATAAGALFARIQQASQAEVTRLGIDSTPTIVVNGKKLAVADWATVQAAIEAALRTK